jgi:replicative DNA helicase
MKPTQPVDGRWRSEIEDALLFTLLLQPDRFAEAAHLAPGDFSKEGHKRIFTAMKSLFAQGYPPDATLTVGELRRTGQYSPEHGASCGHIAEFVRLAPSGNMLPYYIRKIRPAPPKIDHSIALKCRRANR